MWPHEIPLLLAWYSILAILAAGIGAGIAVDSRLRFTRWNRLTGGAPLLLGWLAALVSGGVLLFADLARPVEIGLLYVLLAGSLAIPLLGAPLALGCFLLRVGPDPDVLAGYLAHSLAQLDHAQSAVLLDALASCRRPPRDASLVTRSISHLEPKVRLAAARAGRVAGAGAACDAVRGDELDFERLGATGHPEMVARLRALCAVEDAPRAAVLVGLVRALPGADAAKALRGALPLLEKLDRPAMRRVLECLLETEAGGELYAELLASNRRALVGHATNTLLEVLEKPEDAARAGLGAASSAFLRLRGATISEPLCSKDQVARGRAARLCRALGLPELGEAIHGDTSDFERLGECGQGFVIAQLLANVGSKDDETAFRAVGALAAMARSGRGPDSLPASLDHARDGRAIPLGADRASSLQPLTSEVRGRLREVVEPRLLGGLCHRESATRKSLAACAEALGCEVSLVAAIQGDAGDFERLGRLGDRRLLAGLLETALLQTDDAADAARGVVAACAAGAAEGEQEAVLERLVVLGNEAVRNLAVGGLLARGEAGTAKLLGLLQDQRKAVRLAAAQALVGRVDTARGVFGSAWDTVRQLVTRPHSDTAGAHTDGYHCDYDRGCQMQGVDPHSDFMTTSDAYKARRIDSWSKHADAGIGQDLEPDGHR